MITSHHQITLRPTIHAAVVDEQLVLLDTAKGSYLCRACDGAQVGEDRRTLRLMDRDVAEDLLTGGLADPFAEEAASRRWSLAPRTTALRSSYPPPRLGDAAEAIVALWDLFRRYRGRSLPQLLEDAGVGPSRRGDDVQTPLFDLVDAYQRWAPYAPVSFKCLLRSFLLLRFLHRHGQTADWIFGVTTWPFEAHCWLQVDDVVLDDELDRVSRYTPILVL